MFNMKSDARLLLRLITCHAYVITYFHKPLITAIIKFQFLLHAYLLHLFDNVQHTTRTCKNIKFDVHPKVLSGYHFSTRPQEREREREREYVWIYK